MRRRASPLARVVQVVEVAPIWALLSVLRLFPAKASRSVAAALARTIGPLLPAARVARENIARALPGKSPAEQAAIARGMWDNFGRTMAEFVHRRVLSRRIFTTARSNFDRHDLIAAAARGERVTLVDDFFEVVGAEQFAVLLERRGPALLFAAHMGNWEFLHWTAAHMGMKLAVIYRRPNNPLIARLVEGKRGGTVEFLSKGMEGAFGAARVMETGGTLGFLVDVKENRGIPVPFFGRPAMTGTTLAKFALRYNAPMHGAWVERLPHGRFRIHIEPPLPFAATGDEDRDCATIMAAVNARVEAWVRACPDQWLWAHRRWPKGQ